MFDNISKLDFQPNPTSPGEMLAHAMLSGEGERMDFRTNVEAEGRVRQVLDNMEENKMFSSSGSHILNFNKSCDQPVLTCMPLFFGIDNCSE